MRALIALLCLQFFIAAPQALAACACTPADTLSRLGKANAVFIGKVEKIAVIEKFVEYGNADLPVEVTFMISKRYKGAEENSTFTLKTSLTRDTCTGHPFEEGKEYLVFAYQRLAETFEYDSLYLFPSGTYDVGGLCGGTNALQSDTAKSDIVEIEKYLAALAED